jgi:PAT family acetyl-CoA transporter-like MFS transporter 1
MEDPIASTEMNNPTMKRVPHGDFGNIALLVLLYVLQGVPMGISASVSFILQEKGATLSEQGIFSLASWPFSFKFLWAPLVDSYYVQSVGQRRSWILPLQVTVGLSLLFTAGHLDRLIYQQEADIRVLSTIFF